MIYEYEKVIVEYGIRIVRYQTNLDTTCLFCDDKIYSHVVIELVNVIAGAPISVFGHICEDCLNRGSEENVVGLRERALAKRREALTLEGLACRFEAISVETLNAAQEELVRHVEEAYGQEPYQMYECWGSGKSEVSWRLLESKIVDHSLENNTEVKPNDIPI